MMVPAGMTFTTTSCLRQMVSLTYIAFTGVGRLTKSLTPSSGCAQQAGRWTMVDTTVVSLTTLYTTPTTMVKIASILGLSCLVTELSGVATNAFYRVPLTSAIQEMALYQRFTAQAMEQSHRGTSPKLRQTPGALSVVLRLKTTSTTPAMSVARPSMEPVLRTRREATTVAIARIRPSRRSRNGQRPMAMIKVRPCRHYQPTNNYLNGQGRN